MRVRLTAAVLTKEHLMPLSQDSQGKYAMLSLWAATEVLLFHEKI
jgi:hypothetical protein